jgi:hypothetical protein
MSEKTHDMQNYSLEAILASISTYKKPNVTKRLIFDAAPVGGLSSKWLIGLFLFLPFLEYAGIFNPYIFTMLGIAQAIIFFIVFLSIVMILVFTLASLNNARVVKRITPSWEHYFPEIDLKLIVTSGATPYKDFYKHCSISLNEGLEGEALHSHLKDAFAIMQEQNKELIEAIQKDRSKQQ